MRFPFFFLTLRFYSSPFIPIYGQILPLHFYDRSKYFMQYYTNRVWPLSSLSLATHPLQNVRRPFPYIAVIEAGLRLFGESEW